MKNLVSTDWLSEHLNDPDLMVADIRWMADDENGGRRAYLQQHLPGAVFLDLDHDLADRSDLRRGRHPLPTAESFVSMLTGRGIGRGTKLVVYDDTGGSIAARMWWMMKWIGARNTALLDGGIQKWIAEKRAVESGDVKNAAHPESIQPDVDWSLVTELNEVEHAREYGIILVDARATERYLGHEEPIDARAGHLPGAINIPWAANLTDGEVPVFRAAEELRELYLKAGLGGITDTACYCGSGVTTCLNILALEIAGFENIRLYPGSWSEWVATYPEDDG